MLAEDETMDVDIYDFEPEAKRQSSIATTATTATTPSSILTNSTRPTSSHSAMETDEDWDDACSSGTLLDNPSRAHIEFADDCNQRRRYSSLTERRMN